MLQFTIQRLQHENLHNFKVYSILIFFFEPASNYNIERSFGAFVYIKFCTV